MIRFCTTYKLIEKADRPRGKEKRGGKGWKRSSKHINKYRIKQKDLFICGWGPALWRLALRLPHALHIGVANAAVPKRDQR